MKTLLLVASFGCLAHASANIGQSVKEATVRYGAGKTVDAQKPAQEAQSYSFNGMRILVEFWRGRSNSEQYQKIDGTTFSAAEIAAVLASNVENLSWHQVGDTVWVRLDKAAVAYMGDEKRALVVQSYAFHAEVQKNKPPTEAHKTSLNESPRPTITKIVARYIIPNLAADSFAVKPKTFYLAADTYARIEEQPDPAQHLHGLVITSEPDSWMINLDDRQGKHLVDPGPTFATHITIMDPEAPQELKALEMGKEIDYFRLHQATAIDQKIIDGQACKAVELKQANYRVVLNIRTDTHQPFQLDVFKDDKPDFSLRYVSYEPGIPFDIALFTPPADVTMTEGKSSSN